MTLCAEFHVATEVQMVEALTDNKTGEGVSGDETS